MSRSYRQLYVWQRAKKLAGDVYRETASFPRTEIYGLTSQIRRSAVSIPANIAEGQGRLTRGEFRQFLGHARGSLLELETHLSIASDLGFLTARNYEVIDRNCYELLGLLNRLLLSLESKSNPNRVASGIETLKR